MKKKLMMALIAGMTMSAVFSGSVFAEEASEAEEVAVEATEEEKDEENYETGDASLDNIRNQDEIGENELLVVSFGTSFNDSRRLTIGGIENAIDKAFASDWSVRRAFTAQIIIDHIERRDGYHIDNMKEALDRAVKNGVKKLVVQPTHLMAGFEYAEMTGIVAEYADSFEKIEIGKNLLDTDEDFKRVEKILTEDMAKYDDGKTAIVFMGHGTEHDSNAVYAKMQEVLAADGKKNFYVGTVEATPSLDDVVAAVADKGYERVVLRAMMVVAGDHANNDMADPKDPKSWYSTFAAAGYKVETVLEGIGQIPAIQQMYVEKAQAAIDLLKK